MSAGNTTTPPPLSELPPIPPTIGAIVGPELIGTLLNFTLFGVLAVQTYVYYLSFPNDNAKIKFLVYFIAVFELVQTILNGVDAFHLYASGFGNLITVTSVGLGPIYSPIFESIIALIVQTFFCYRIYIIRRSAWWLSAIIFTLSLIQVAGGIGGGILSLIDVSVQASASKIVVTAYLWLIGSAVADVLIAIAMTVLLLQSKSGMRSSANDAVKRIIELVIETNAMTASVALIGLLVWATLPGTTYFICPTMIIGKLYANTILLTFNNRAFIRRPGDTSYNSMGSSFNASGSRTMAASGRSAPFSAGLKLEQDQLSSNHLQMDVSVTNHTIDDGGSYGRNMKTSGL